MVPGLEQIGDEIHPAIQVDPVQGVAAPPIFGGPVVPIEQGGQIIDDDRSQVGGHERQAGQGGTSRLSRSVPSGVSMVPSSSVMRSPQRSLIVCPGDATGFRPLPPSPVVPVRP